MTGSPQLSASGPGGQTLRGRLPIAAGSRLSDFQSGCQGDVTWCVPPQQIQGMPQVVTNQSRKSGIVNIGLPICQCLPKILKGYDEIHVYKSQKSDKPDHKPPFEATHWIYHKDQ